MTAQMALQIKELFQDKAEDCIKFILGGETAESLQKICSFLPEAMANSLRTLFEALLKEKELSKEEEYDIGDEQQRKKMIDRHLQNEELQQKNESFLEMISKINEKLIYQEHYGYPFYDLCKRILITNGDLRPLQPTIKTIHSQVQILYSTLFSKQVLQWIGENYENLTTGFKGYLMSIFPTECEKYFKFHRVYKHIKKETAQQQHDLDENEEQNKEISIDNDQTLEMDEKEFLVSLSDSAEEFQQFQKNRSYNFLCFGLRNYETYIGLGPTIFSQIKEREFCQLLSFLSIRFIRRIVFKIIKEKGNGKLFVMKEPITSQEIIQIGNEVVDSISHKINEYLTPIKSIEEDAKALYFAEFEPYSYKDFLPRKAVGEAKMLDLSLAEHVWRTCKEYKTIWSQRIRVQNYFKHGGVKPQFDYVSYVEEHKQKYKKDPGKTWKDFIMIKFGFETEQRVVCTRKKMKLDSLND